MVCVCVCVKCEWCLCVRCECVRQGGGDIPQLLCHLLSSVSRHDEHLLHFLPQHVARVANILSRLCIDTTHKNIQLKKSKTIMYKTHGAGLEVYNLYRDLLLPLLSITSPLFGGWSVWFIKNTFTFGRCTYSVSE